MTAGHIVLIVVKTILAAIPFIATILLIGYFERPSYPGKQRYTAYFFKGMGLWFLCFTLSVLNAMALAGIFSLKIFLFLIPAVVYTVLMALALMIGTRVRGGPRPEIEEYKREVSQASGGFIDSLVAARKEYSDYYVAEYYRFKKEHPNARYSMKILGQGAVKKDKRNPEAQFILADYYLASNELQKAQKHAAIALELDPGNGKYRELSKEISRRLASEV